MEVITVRHSGDFISYLVVDTASRECAGVDPYKSERIIAEATSRGLTITTILITHQHRGFEADNAEMARLLPGVRVIGGRADRIATATLEVDDGDTFLLGSLEVRVIGTPCHTPGHVCYYLPYGDGAVISGDTLLTAGCGLFFDGTPAQMYSAMMKLAALPSSTAVYSHSDYTVTNLRFALTVEPTNADMAARLAWAVSVVDAGKTTGPSTIASELLTNPFMRVNTAPVRLYASTTGSLTLSAAPCDEDGATVIGFIRQQKNEFGKK